MGSSGSQFDERLQAGTGNKGIIFHFYSWLQNLHPYHYKYVVATTRRAFNLVEAVRKKYPDALPNYITENGLLLLAEDAAKSYKETGRFPETAIVDDILVYGRSMNLLLSQFWNTVRQCLYRLDADIDEEEAEEAFIRSIHLWIYAVNEAPILLRHEFQWALHCQEMMTENQWRDLSDSIARLIAAEDVANTSYVISAKLRCKSNRYQPNHASWISDNKLRYRNNRQHYTFYLFTPASKPGVYPSVRSYKKRGFLYFTPYFFMPELNWPQMIRILKAVFDISSQQDARTTIACIHLLNRIKTYPSRMAVYAQFAALLLSQITLSVFFERLDSELELIYDTEKIAHNFGFPKGIGPVLDRFCKIKWHESQLIELLNCLEVSNAADEVPYAPAANAVSRSEIVNTVERLTYKQAVDHERDAATRKLHNRADVPRDPFVNRTGEQDLDRFLGRARRQTGVGMDAVSMLPVLSCLTQMMDLGDISLKARFKYRSGTPVLCSSVRTTEMSLAIMPRKLSIYYQQFYLLARLYWRDQDFPDRVEHYFRDMIFAGDADNRNAVMISNARYFAQQIAENRIIMNSMLNWEVTPEREV